MRKVILFIFSELPTVGKSTLARFLVKEFGAVYLRIGTIEQGLKDLCRINVEGEGYRLVYRTTADNLRLGDSVVVDNCNLIELTRREWEEVAANNNYRFVNIEVICPDKTEHKKRAEQRNTEVANMNLPVWDGIESREYHGWHKSRIVIETAGETIKQCQTELKKKVADSLSREGDG